MEKRKGVVLASVALATGAAAAVAGVWLYRKHKNVLYSSGEDSAYSRKLDEIRK